jgi:ABC-type sugar transport system substrate-binding protein
VQARSFPPAAAARAPDGGAAAEREMGKTDAGAKFAELRRVWTRPWPDNDDREARAAFAKAVEEGADPDTIIAAAEWVRLADHPRFLPKLPG